MSNRRQAFARTPRGGAKTTGPTKGSGNDSAPVRIDRAFIEKFHKATVDTDLANVATEINGAVVFEVNPQGGVNQSLVVAGAKVADRQDIQRISGMNSFIANERREAAKDAVTGNMKKLFYALFTLSEYTNSDDIPAHDRTLISIYRPCEQMMRILNKNVDQITGEYEHLDGVIRDHILLSKTRIRNAIGRYLIAKFKDIGETKKLNEFFFEARVPIFVVQRLTQAFVDLKSSKGALSTFYFPKDQGNGFTLSYKELIDNDFCTAQGRILSASKVVRKFFKNRANFEHFLNINEDSELRDSEEAWLGYFANVPIMIPAPMMDARSAVDIAKARGLRGNSWNMGRTTQPKDILKFMGTLFKRASILSLPSPRSQVSLLRMYFPGYVYNPGAAEKDPYVQLANYVEASNEDFNLFSAATDRAKYNDPRAREVLLQWFSVYMGVPFVRGPDFDALAAALDFRLSQADPTSLRMLEGTPVFELNGTSTNATDDKWTEIVTAMALVNLESSDVTKILADKFAVGKKDKKEVKPNDFQIRSQLTDRGVELVRRLKARREKTLADRIDKWLRAFQKEVVQIAVANILLARFDAFFAEQAPKLDPESLRGVVSFGDTGAGGTEEPVESDPDEDQGDEGDDAPPS